MLTKNTSLLKLLDNGGFMDSGGSVNPFMGYIVKQSLEDDFNGYVQYLNEMKQDMTNKMSFIESQLDLYPTHFSYEKPDGGYFIFFKTHKLNGTKFEKLCDKAQLNFHNAGKFGSNPIYTDNYYRISISYYSIEDLENYLPVRLKLLVELIDKEIISSQMEPKILVLG
jgi:DNA-binding transcriptional MocR family regulator